MNSSDILPHISSNDDSAFESLVERIVSLVSEAKGKIMQQIDDTLVTTNWHIGEYIVEFEQDGQARASYGEGLMRNLSKRLTLRLGKGYSLSNLHNMRRLYLFYPKFQTVSGKLSWSHWCELLELDDNLERQFYENECISQRWGSSYSSPSNRLWPFLATRSKSRQERYS